MRVFVAGDLWYCRHLKSMASIRRWKCGTHGPYRSLRQLLLILTSAVARIQQNVYISSKSYIFSISKDALNWSKVTLKTCIMLDKYCSFELSIHQRVLKKNLQKYEAAQLFSIIRNVSWEANQHIRQPGLIKIRTSVHFLARRRLSVTKTQVQYVHPGTFLLCSYISGA